MMMINGGFKIWALAFSVLLWLSVSGSNILFADELLPGTQWEYSILLYSDDILYGMNPDGSGLKELLVRPDVQDFIPLSEGRIVIHSKQYEGESLEIFDPSAGTWALVEFSEGVFPNIDTSEDGSIVVYEVKHIPITIEGDGVWVYSADGGKSHVKVSGTALSIESILLYKDYLYLLYHELDLISDEAGLFVEKTPVNRAGKSHSERIPEGTKLFLDDGYVLGFAYPKSGRTLELKHLTNETLLYTIEMSGGDVVFDAKGFHMGVSPVLCFNRGQLQEDGTFKYETRLWYAESNEIWPVEIPGITEMNNFNWSPDGWLFFTASYQDKSGENSSPMLFRYEPRKDKLELVSVHGGPVEFMAK